MAGNGTYGPYNGDNRLATTATFQTTDSLAVDGLGNLFIAERFAQRVLKVSASGIITTVAGNGSAGYNGDNRAAINAQLNSPRGVAVDALGNIFIGDFSNHRVRKVDSSGNIATIAGIGPPGSYSGDNGPATAAGLNGPKSVTVDGLGNVFFIDSNNHRVRKVSPSGAITTVAGTGTAGYNGDSLVATSTKLYYPTGLAVDASGSIFIADTFNDRVCKVSTSGLITTVAGNGTSGYSGDNRAATSAQLSLPNGVAVDGSGNLFISDQNSNRVRKVDTLGTITTVYNGSTAALAVDGSGNLFIAGNFSVRKVYPV